MQSLLDDPINASMDKKIFSGKVEDFYVGMMDPYGKKKNPLNNKPYSPRFSYLAFTNDVKIEYDQIDPKVIAQNMKDAPINRKGWAYAITYEKKPDFFTKLLRNQVILFIAGTGVGKTQVAPMLAIHALGYKLKVLIGMPTITSVTGMSPYAAKLYDVEHGDEVGYQAGGKKMNNRKTKIQFCTVGSIIALISSNPTLEGIGCVMIDEVHQRQFDMDMAIAMITNIITTVRPDLKLVLISATIKKETFIPYFEKNNIKVDTFILEGETSKYKVLDKWYPTETKPNDIQSILLFPEVDKLAKMKEPGHVLVFITAMSQANLLIKKLEGEIKKNPGNYPIKPWLSGLDGKTDDVIKDYIIGKTDYTELGDFGRKITFATNAVEASVTFSPDTTGIGLRWVIDTGLRIKVSFNAKKYANEMDTVFIAQSNIEQRRGRTGRTEEGTCVYMYTEKQFKSFPYDQTLAIVEEDLTSAFLNVMALPSMGNFSNTVSFFRNMLMPPPLENISVASHNLISNKFMYPPGDDKAGQISGLGRLCSSFGKFGVNAARMIIAGYYFGCMKETIYLTAIITRMVKGFTSMFTLTIKPGATSLDEKSMEALSKYSHAYGEHIALLRIYQKSLDPNIYQTVNGDLTVNKKKSERMRWAKTNLIKYNELEEIDSNVLEVMQIVKQNLVQIRLGNFINIVGFEDQANFLKLAKKKLGVSVKIGGGIPTYTPNNPYFSETRNDTNNNVLSGGDSPQNGNKPKQQNDGNKQQKDGKKKWSQKKKKPFKKKSLKQVERVLRDGEHFLDRIPKKDTIRKAGENLLENYQKGEQFKKDKAKLAQEFEKKLAADDGTDRTSPQYKATELLDRIKWYEIDETKPISRFKDKADNIIACLFYGYFTHIAAYVRDGNQASKTYVVKNINPKNPYIKAVIKKTMFDRQQKHPSIIIYDSCTISTFNTTFNLVSRLPATVVKKFIDLKK